MRVYIAADKKPLTSCSTRSLANIVAQGRWAPWVTDQNGCVADDMTEQCQIILLARERGLMAENV